MKKLLFVLGILLTGLTGCRDEGEPLPSNPQGEMRTFISYIVSNNSSSDLDDYYKVNLVDMYNGLSKMKTKSNLLVFYRPRTKVKDELIPVPTILKLQNDGEGRINGEPIRHLEFSDTTYVVHLADKLKTYDNSIVSTEPAQMEAIMKDLASFAPDEKVGISLSSHGLSWVAGTDSRFFGDDGGTSISTPTLSRLMQNSFGPRLDLLVFDACEMGQAEVFYDLRNCTNYCIGSSASVPGRGFPYELIMPDLLTPGESHLQSVCTKYEAFYSNCSKNEIITCHAIKLNKMESLAQEVKKLLAENADHLRGEFFDSVQCYGANHGSDHINSRFSCVDMADYFRLMTPEKKVPANLQRIINEAVVGKGFVNTDSTFTEYHNPLQRDRYCGMSMFVPDAKDFIECSWELNREYNARATEWYKVVGWDQYRIEGFSDPRAIMTMIISNDELDQQVKHDVKEIYTNLVCSPFQKMSCLIYFYPCKNDPQFDRPMLLRYTNELRDGKTFVNGQPKLKESERSFEKLIQQGEVVQEYEPGQDWSHPEQLRRIHNDMVNANRALHVSLVFNARTRTKEPMHKSLYFGNNEHRIDVPTMADILTEVYKDRKVDCIVFDSDNKANIEAMYEFRDFGNIFIGSTTIMPDDGFDYFPMLYYLESTQYKNLLLRILQDNENYYIENKAPEELITLSAFDLRYMERIGESIKAIIQGNPDLLRADFINQVQCYGNLETQVSDMYQSIDAFYYFASLSNSEELDQNAWISSIYQLLNDFIDGIKVITLMPSELPAYGPMDINQFCGIGMFIPDLDPANELLNIYAEDPAFKKSDWYKLINWDAYRLKK